MYQSTMKRQLLAILLTLLAVVVFGQLLKAQDNGTANNNVKVFLPLIANVGDVEPNADTQLEKRYIVVFNDELVSAASVTSLAAELTSLSGGTLGYIYDTLIHGFSLSVPASNAMQVIDRLRQDMRVAYVEESRTIKLPAYEMLVMADEQEHDQVIHAAQLQNKAPWGLDRIDQRNLPLNKQYNYNHTGAGVRVYVVDSGILNEHNEFGGRVRDYADLVDGNLPAEGCDHGTAVAGIIGGKTYGVAKAVELIDVRVFNCKNGGDTDKIVEALQMIAEDHAQHPNTPAIVNLSLQVDPASDTIDNHVRALISRGIIVVTGAGNGYIDDQGNKKEKDCDNFSPSHLPEVITVSATNKQDVRATFQSGRANIGDCVDLFAPGLAINTASHKNSSAKAIAGGTSFAAPHVSGAAALYLETHPTWTQTEVEAALIREATPNIVRDPGEETQPRLLFIDNSVRLSQKIGIPAYFYPGQAPGNQYWSQLIQGAPIVGMAIVNPSSGVGDQIDLNYQAQVSTLKNRGIKPLGYVNTKDVRPIAEIKSEIDRYIAWYGIRDIMLDWVPTAGCSTLSYYQAIYTYIRTQTATATVVISPGTNFDECLMNIGSDVIAISYEDTYAKYKKWRPNSWMANYPPERFWHLITATPAGSLADAIARSKQHRVGWVFVTPDKNPNPWDTLPSTSYWQNELTFANNQTVTAADLLTVAGSEEEVTMEGEE